MHVFFSYSRIATLNLSVYSFDHALEYFEQKMGILPINVWKNCQIDLLDESFVLWFSLAVIYHAAFKARQKPSAKRRKEFG